MMARRADREERAVDARVERARSRRARRPRRRSRLRTTLAHRGVGVERRRRRRAHPLESVEVRGRMHPLELGPCRWAAGRDGAAVEARRGRDRRSPLRAGRTLGMAPARSCSANSGSVATSTTRVRVVGGRAPVDDGPEATVRSPSGDDLHLTRDDAVGRGSASSGCGSPLASVTTGVPPCAAATAHHASRPRAPPGSRWCAHRPRRPGAQLDLRPPFHRRDREPDPAGQCALGNHVAHRLRRHDRRGDGGRGLDDVSIPVAYLPRTGSDNLVPIGLQDPTTDATRRASADRHGRLSD